MFKLFNSTFELSLRILMLLSESEESMTVDRLLSYDFITIYGRNFGVSNESLHGDNNFGFGEFASRRQIMQQALKELAIDGMINILQKDSGFHFLLNNTGRDYCEKLAVDYSGNYRSIARNTIEKYRTMSDQQIFLIITEESRKSLRR